MTELDRARKHLLGVQRELRMARAGHFNDEWIAAAETCLLAALSWVWEEQQKVLLPTFGPQSSSADVFADVQSLFDGLVRQEVRSSTMVVSPELMKIIRRAKVTTGCR